MHLREHLARLTGWHWDTIKIAPTNPLYPYAIDGSHIEDSAGNVVLSRYCGPFKWFCGEWESLPLKKAPPWRVLLFWPVLWVVHGRIVSNAPATPDDAPAPHD